MTDWKFKDRKFKKILARHNDPDDELQSVTGTITELVPHLKTCPVWRPLPKAVIASIEKATTFHSLNRAIDSLYDFADDNKIWLGFIP